MSDYSMRFLGDVYRAKDLGIKCGLLCFLVISKSGELSLLFFKSITNFFC